MRTSRARLGTAVLLAPLHHPLRLAEDLAVVDQLSGGRLDVGLAPGYKPDEFAVLGVPKAERGARTDETIEILQLAWRGERFSYAGKHFTFDDVIVAPPPVQPGRAADLGRRQQPGRGPPGGQVRHLLHARLRRRPGRLRRLPDTGDRPAPGGHQPGAVRRGQPGEGLGDLRRSLPLPVQRVPAVVLRGRATTTRTATS